MKVLFIGLLAYVFYRLVFPAKAVEPPPSFNDDDTEDFADYEEID